MSEGDPQDQSLNGYASAENEVSGDPPSFLEEGETANRLRVSGDSPVNTGGSSTVQPNARLQTLNQNFEVAADRHVIVEIPRMVQKPFTTIRDKVVSVSIPHVQTVTETKPLELHLERLVVTEVKIPTERFVENVVQVPVQNILEKVVERIVEVPVTKTVPKIVTRVVEKIIEKTIPRVVKVKKVIFNEKVVEKRVEITVDEPVIRRVEVPYDRVVEKLVEVPYEKVIERRVEVEVEKLVDKMVTVPQDVIREKIVEVEVDEEIDIVEVPVHEQHYDTSSGRRITLEEQGYFFKSTLGRSDIGSSTRDARFVPYPAIASVSPTMKPLPPTTTLATLSPVQRRTAAAAEVDAFEINGGSSAGYVALSSDGFERNLELSGRRRYLSDSWHVEAGGVGLAASGAMIGRHSTPTLAKRTFVGMEMAGQGIFSDTTSNISAPRYSAYPIHPGELNTMAGRINGVGVVSPETAIPQEGRYIY